MLLPDVTVRPVMFMGTAKRKKNNVSVDITYYEQVRRGPRRTKDAVKDPDGIDQRGWQELGPDHGAQGFTLVLALAVVTDCMRGEIHVPLIGGHAERCEWLSHFEFLLCELVSTGVPAQELRERGKKTK